MASTFGSGGGSQRTVTFDALLTSSLFKMSKTIEDQISTSNALFHKIKSSNMWKSYEGGNAIEERLMYELGNMEWYEGYDELSVDPTDGLTLAEFVPREAAAPVSISRREERINSGDAKVFDLLDTKIDQLEMGMQEGFAKSILQGRLGFSATGAITDNPINPGTGSLGIDPIPKLIYYASASGTEVWSSLSVGNLDQATYPWWRNQSKNFGGSAVTPAEFMLIMDEMYNNCSKGPGGGPTLIWVDQKTYELWRAAYYKVYRATQDSDNNYPFPNFKFNNAVVTWDEKIPDVHNGTATVASTGKGTAYFINTKFMKVRYDAKTNFVMTPFQKPARQTAKVAHMLWMGAMTINNRRKMGVVGNIPRSLTLT